MPRGRCLALATVFTLTALFFSSAPRNKRESKTLVSKKEPLGHAHAKLYLKYLTQRRSLRLPTEDAERRQKKMFDAIIVPGGGLEKNGQPHLYVKLRLQKAWELRNSTTYIIMLSRGTTHKAPPLGSVGFPIDECKASANYIYSLGDVRPQQILLECSSLDTIGNAAFTLLTHTEAGGMVRLSVISSDFQIERLKSIFDHIFSLGRRTYEISYTAVPTIGVSKSVLARRARKETVALRHWEEVSKPQLRSLQDLHRFLMISHDAYSFFGSQKFDQERKGVPAADMQLIDKTY